MVTVHLMKYSKYINFIVKVGVEMLKKAAKTHKERIMVFIIEDMLLGNALKIFYIIE